MSMLPHISKAFLSALLLTAGVFVSATAQSSLMEFTLPWNDRSQNVTNLSSTLHTPAGRYGRVSISEEGHYTLNGERIRFFGANIAAAACFPSKTMANEVAQRYARFGFNAVRFHHMDNNWTETLIDYGQGSSLHLDPVQLDKLDYFVAALKNAGVYVNLNLLNSRNFYSEDGLGDEVSNIAWKEQAILGFFHEGARNLQKDYALKLLTHVNPYTDLSYAEDPAIAFVEVNNENGLIHMWHSGALDRLPPTYASSLRLAWNQWLQAKYLSHSDLLAAWNPIDEPFGPNMIQNGTLASGESWNLEQHGIAVANTAYGTYDQRSGVRIRTTTAGDAGWHVQFNQANLVLQEGQIYTLGFWIKGDPGKNVSASLTRAHGDYQTLDYSQNIVLSDTWTYYEATFFAGVSEPNARFNLGNLASTTGDVFVSDVQLRTGGQVGTLAEDVTLESGNIPAVQKHGGATVSANLDWFRFMRATEIAYWQDMEAFIKALGYAGIQWGTTIMNSPPSVQDSFEVTDSHAYWSHPNFLDSEWSSTRWSVSNAPMVNDGAGGVIPDLAWQRIRGRPHNVTEYQHCAPNVYSSDAGLFAGIYGSIQDWDGIYLFHYGSDSSDWDRGYFNGFFDIDQHPAKLVNAAIASLAFRRFDIPAAENEFVVPFGPETELNVLATQGAAWSVGDARHLEFSSHIAKMHRISMDLSQELASTDFIIPEVPSEPVYPSDNGAVVWDLSEEGQGVLTVSTERLKSVIGFDADRVFNLGGIVIDPQETELGWSAISAVLTRGSGFSALSTGASGILVAAGYAENTNMGWTDDNNTSVGNQWGGAPSLVENVAAVVTLAAPAESVSVWALDVRGNRRAQLEVLPVENVCYFVLGGELGSLWYEFVIDSH